jgi:hypothetical protein
MYLFQNQVRIQRDTDYLSRLPRSANYLQATSDPAAKAGVNKLYDLLQTLPLYEGILEPNEKKCSSFHIAHDNTVPICHVTSCPPWIPDG